MISVVSIIYGRILCMYMCRILWMYMYKYKNMDNLQENDADVDMGDDVHGERLSPSYIQVSDDMDDDNFNVDSLFARLVDTTTSSPVDTGTLVDAGENGIENENDEMIQVDRNENLVQQERKRLYYLDNLKIFLTFLVVSHHLTCAFGGCGPGGWVLIVGIYDNSFKPFADAFTQLNQGYFMSLFFFISAYFVPSSYEKKGKNMTAFLYEKAKRYWLPAIFVTYIMAPLIILYCVWFVGEDVKYIPTAFHCWFLYWLLVLNLAYAHIRGREDECEEDTTSQETQTIPGPSKRLLIYGLGICGFVMMVIFVMLGEGTFCTMPLVWGSLANDLLFFAAGTVARKHRWLEKNLTEQIGMSPFLLRIMVLLEAVLMCYFFRKCEEDTVYFIPGFLVAGVYCVDMSLALLEFFQTNLDFQNRFTQCLSDAAYTVYIIHPVFVVGVTSIWIAYYESRGKVIEWTDLYSTTPIDGGGLTLAKGWLASNVLTTVLLWPSAWFLRKLPGLRRIL